MLTLNGLPNNTVHLCHSSQSSFPTTGCFWAGHSLAGLWPSAAKDRLCAEVVTQWGQRQSELMWVLVSITSGEPLPVCSERHLPSHAIQGSTSVLSTFPRCLKGKDCHFWLHSDTADCFSNSALSEMCRHMLQILVYLRTAVCYPPATLTAGKGWCHQPWEVPTGTQKDSENRTWFFREGRSLDHPLQLLLNIEGSLEGSSVMAVLRQSTATLCSELIRQRSYCCFYARHEWKQ